MDVDEFIKKAFDWYYEEAIWNINMNNEDAVELFKDTDAYKKFNKHGHTGVKYINKRSIRVEAR